MTKERRAITMNDISNRLAFRLFIQALLVSCLFLYIGIAVVAHSAPIDRGSELYSPTPMDYSPTTTSEYVECITYVSHSDSPYAQHMWDMWVDTMPPFINIDYANGMYIRDGVVIAYAMSEDGEIANEKICLL